MNNKILYLNNSYEVVHSNAPIGSYLSHLDLRYHELSPDAAEYKLIAMLLL